MPPIFWVRFAKNQNKYDRPVLDLVKHPRWSGLAFPLRPLSQPHSGATVVLVDELDAVPLEGTLIHEVFDHIGGAWKPPPPFPLLVGRDEPRLRSQPGNIGWDYTQRPNDANGPKRLFVVFDFGRFPEANPRPSTVLVDELDAGRFQSATRPLNHSPLSLKYSSLASSARRIVVTPTADCSRQLLLRSSE